MRRIVAVALLTGIVLTVAPVAVAFDADDLSDLLGYTMVAFTNVDGEFEGAEYGKLLQLENHMVFEFHEYNYSYSYRPSVAVFANHVSAGDMLKAGVKSSPSGGRTFYKLVIDDEIYDVGRVR